MTEAAASFSARALRPQHGLSATLPALFAPTDAADVAASVEVLQARRFASSVKLHLAAIRMLFDWLVVGQVVPSNPACSVRGPRHPVRKGATPVLTAEEARTLLASIGNGSAVDLCDRALMQARSWKSTGQPRVGPHRRAL